MVSIIGEAFFAQLLSNPIFVWPFKNAAMQRLLLTNARASLYLMGIGPGGSVNASGDEALCSKPRPPSP